MAQPVLKLKIAHIFLSTVKSFHESIKCPTTTKESQVFSSWLQGHPQLPAPAPRGLEGQQQGELHPGGVRADEEVRPAPKGREEAQHHRARLQGLRRGHPADVLQGRARGLPRQDEPTARGLFPAPRGRQEAEQGRQLTSYNFLAELHALKHESMILGHSSNPVCGFSMMERVRHLDSVLFGPWRTGLALPLTRYRVGPLSENNTLVL